VEKQFRSKGRLRNLNARQRKKLHLGEFQQRLFKIQAHFHQPMDQAAHEEWLGHFLGFIESRRLLVIGMGGNWPLTQVDGMILSRRHHTSSDEDRQAVAEWLQTHHAIASANFGEWVDSWYGEAG